MLMYFVTLSYGKKIVYISVGCILICSQWWVLRKKKSYHFMFWSPDDLKITKLLIYKFMGYQKIFYLKRISCAVKCYKLL